MTTNPLTSAAVEQLQWHWQNLLRPRPEGLTDEELLWDPTGDDQQAGTVHSADEQRTAHQAGAGDLVIDFDLVEGAAAAVHDDLVAAGARDRGRAGRA